MTSMTSKSANTANSTHPQIFMKRPSVNLKNGTHIMLLTILYYTYYTIHYIYYTIV